MLSRELQNVSILEAPKIETLDSRAVRRSENPVGASSNMVGIICPPGWDGFNDLPKSEITHAPHRRGSSGSISHE